MEHLLLLPIQRKGDNLLQKYEQEDMHSVCQVMEDLIRMQSTIFTVSIIYIQLYVTLPNRITVCFIHSVNIHSHMSCTDQTRSYNYTLAHTHTTDPGPTLRYCATTAGHQRP